MSNPRYALPVTIRRAAFSGERLVAGDGWQECVPVHRCLHRDWSPLNEREEPAEGEALAGLVEVRPGPLPQPTDPTDSVWVPLAVGGFRSLTVPRGSLVKLDWQARALAAEAQAFSRACEAVGDAIGDVGISEPWRSCYEAAYAACIRELEEAFHVPAERRWKTTAEYRTWSEERHVKRLAWRERLDAAEARASRLAAALSLARTRLEICLGRFRGCTGEGHGVSEVEIPGWLEETERALEGDKTHETRA